MACPGDVRPAEFWRMRHSAELHQYDDLDEPLEAAPNLSPVDAESLRAILEYQMVRSEAALTRKDAELRRLRAEVECLQIIKQRFESIVDNVPVWLFSCGSDGAVTFMNNGFSRFTGHPASAALGDGWMNFVHPEDASAVRAALGKAMVTGISVGATLRAIAQDGEYVEFRATGSVVRDGGGKVIEWYGSLSPTGVTP